MTCATKIQPIEYAPTKVVPLSRQIRAVKEQIDVLVNSYRSPETGKIIGRENRDLIEALRNACATLSIIELAQKKVEGN